ncbi:MAG: hypothetical protein ACLFR1_05110 [Spirochaetia bacterium]
MKKLFVCIIILVFSVSLLFSQDLDLSSEDLIIEQSLEGGFDLYIRNKDDIQSVLLTESTADPEMQNAVYAYRSPEYNTVNGDELRMLNGEFLDNDDGLYSLIDSTPEPHEELGSAYHIFIPYVVEYGYPWTRSGELLVVDGTYLNIRTFPLPYADYAEGFVDNPYELSVTQAPREGPPEENYMEDTVDAYTAIAENSEGEAVYSEGSEDTVGQIGRILQNTGDGDLDLVLALDTTESMLDDIPVLRESLVPLLEAEVARFDSYRVGMVLYKDYMENYVTRVLPFVDSLESVQRYIDRVRVYGGRDIPEAVHEAIYSGLSGFEWAAQNRVLILVGDAPPHSRPRGEVTEDMLYMMSEELGVRVYTIILPQ